MKTEERRGSNGAISPYMRKKEGGNESDRRHGDREGERTQRTDRRAPQRDGGEALQHKENGLALALRVFVRLVESPGGVGGVGQEPVIATNDRDGVLRDVRF